MSVVFRSIPHSTDGVFNAVFSITGKHSNSCRKTKHGEDKLHSLSQDLKHPKEYYQNTYYNKSFYPSYHFCSVIKKPKSNVRRAHFRAAQTWRVLLPGAAT